MAGFLNRSSSVGRSISGRIPRERDPKPPNRTLSRSSACVGPRANLPQTKVLGAMSRSMLKSVKRPLRLESYAASAV